FRRVFAHAPRVECGPTDVDVQVAADGPARWRQRLKKCGESNLRIRVIGSVWHEHANTPHALALLRPRRERPRCCRTGNHLNEIAPSHAAALPRRSGQRQSYSTCDDSATLRIETAAGSYLLGQAVRVPENHA